LVLSKENTANLPHLNYLSNLFSQTVSFKHAIFSTVMSICAKRVGLQSAVEREEGVREGLGEIGCAVFVCVLGGLGWGAESSFE
jgi:hypothetical protein